MVPIVWHLALPTFPRIRGVVQMQTQTQMEVTILSFWTLEQPHRRHIECFLGLCALPRRNN